MMESKSADLVKVKVKLFVSVQIIGTQVFALAQDGSLFMFDKDRKLIKAVNTKIEIANACITDGELIYCGGADG